MAKMESGKRKAVSPAEALPDDFGDLTPAPIGAGVSDQVSVPAAPAETVRTVRIEAFLAADLGEGYVSRHADCRLSRKQGEILRRLWRGLNERHERLESGRHVENTPDAIKWLLERLDFAESES